MLTSNSIELGFNLSEFLTDSGKKARGKQSTLMGELVTSLSTPFETTDFSNREDVISYQEYISRGTQEASMGGGSVYMPSEHDTIMDNYIDDLSSLVVNHLAFTRSTVNGEINKFSEKLRETLGSHCLREPEEFFNVTYYSLPELFNSELLKVELRQYEGNVNAVYKQEISLKGFFETLDSERFHDYFLTGNASIDEEILNYLASVKDSLVSWLNSPVKERDLPVTCALEYSLVNYLFYRRLAEEKDINTGDNLTVLTNKAIDNRDYFAEVLVANLRTYEHYINGGYLLGSQTEVNFSYLSKKAFEVLIFEENFTKAVEEGSNIEAIFGYLASRESSHNLKVGNLVSKTGDYLEIWRRTRSLYLIQLNEDRLQVFNHLVGLEFDNSMSESNLTEAEKEQLAIDPNYVKNSSSLAHGYLSGLEVKDIDDINKISLDLIAGIRFRFTNAHELLYKMDSMLNADEKLDPKEAALYAAIDHVLDYCVSQVEFLDV